MKKQIFKKCFLFFTSLFSLSSCDSKTPIEITAIEIVDAKKTYFIGDEFSNARTIVRGVYSDGTSKILKNEDLVIDDSLFNSRVPNKSKINVSLKDSELKAEYEVEVERNKEDLKILSIGNSFSEDAHSHLYEIAKEAGAKNVTLANLYIGGCDLSRHNENIKDDKAVYEYQYNDNGEIKRIKSKSISRALKEKDWDIITIQQASGSSGIAETYNQNLNDLVNYVYDNKPKETTNVAWHMTWAYEQTSNHREFYKYNKDQKTMYEAIVNCVKNKILPLEKIDIVIPTGTAIQNVRNSKIGDTITRDGYHLSEKEGRHTAGLMYLLSSTGWDIDSLTLKDSKINKDIVEILIQATKMAYENPFEVTLN